MTAPAGEMGGSTPDAYHEAGHAVIAVVLKMWLKRVTIEPEGDTLGLTVVRTPLAMVRLMSGLDAPSPRKRQVMRQLVYGLAGEAAERRYTGRCEVAGAAGDHEALRNLVQRVTTYWLEWVLEAFERADEMVQQEWPAIVAVAQELENERTLSARVVRRLVRDYRKGSE